MWLPVAIIVVVLAVGYGWARQNGTTGPWVLRARNALGLL